MSEQSTKEIEERYRFSPRYEEKQRERKRLMVEWFLESNDEAAGNARAIAAIETKEAVDDWIAEETDRRIAEECEEHMPIICGRVKP